MEELGDEWRGYFLHLGREVGSGNVSRGGPAGMKTDRWWEERRGCAGSLFLSPHLLLVFHPQLISWWQTSINKDSIFPFPPPPPLFIYPTITVRELNPLIDSFSVALKCYQMFGYQGDIMVWWATGSISLSLPVLRLFPCPLSIRLIPGSRFLNVIWALSDAGRKDVSGRGVSWWRTKVVGWDTRWGAERSGLRGLLERRRFDYGRRPGNGDGCWKDVRSAPLNNGIRRKRGAGQINGVRHGS